MTSHPISNPTATVVDGRTARRHRNRAAVLDAVIELFEEGDLTPGVHEVAERSGVSLRSVYRYFADVDDLILAAIDRQLDGCAPLFRGLDVRGGTDERIRSFCEHRIALFTSCRTAFRAALIRSSDQPKVRERVQRCRATLAEQVDTAFAEEIGGLPADEADVVSGMLDSLSQFDAIEHLAVERALDAEGSTQFLVGAFTRILCCRR